MPFKISTSSPSTLAESLKASSASSTSKPSFILLFASPTSPTGHSWCGDCRTAEPILEERFKNREDDVTLVYVGGRDEWRRDDNPWKRAPFSIERLPTLIKVTNEKWESLVEADVYDREKLDPFIDA